MTAPFSLLVKPASADCNLRCDYCFYLEKADLYPGTKVHRMSDDVLERMIRTYMATDQPVYTFGWQGGEPTLMGADFFRKVTELQKKWGRPGAVVANGLQTNGVLVDDDLAAHLAEYRFLAGVSLDGPPEMHDRYRRDAAGGGSHDAALRAIEILDRRHVQFNILVLVSRANVGHAREVYRYLRDRGFHHHQYIPCVAPAEFAVTGEEWGEFLCAVFEEWRGGDVGRVSVRDFDAVIARLAGRPECVCTFGRDCRQYFLVEHNGDVYPCDFFVEPQWKLGNVADASWEAMLESPLYRRFGERKAQWDARCGACAFLDLCAADCPRNRTPDVSRLCAGWMRFFGETREHFARLAGLSA
ncbi:MAG: anaerobic sulfatase maturase [Planctomycetota bacterium]|jgi:uncharacterized protein